MKIIDGKKIALQIESDLQNKVNHLKENGITPGLGIILVGNDPASEIYVRNKLATCKRLGIRGEFYRFNEENTEEEIISCICELNAREEIDGIIVQSPVLACFNEEKILSYIDPKKDVDGFGIFSLGKLLSNQEDILAATPLGILKLLEHEQEEIEGKHIVVVGAGLIVGRPLAIMLLNRGATVTIAHKKTKDLAQITREADILIVAIGEAHFITSEYVKEGAVVIDVGINRVSDHIYGDVDFDEVAKKASLITPVPGGVGPMTIAMLLKNVVDCAKRRNEDGSEN